MPPIPANPVAKSHLDKLQGLLEEDSTAGEREIERRSQEIYHEFLKAYFTGSPVPVADGSGGVTNMTFHAASLLYDQATVPDTLDKPVIHMTISNRRQIRRDRIQGFWMVQERIDRSWLIRVPSQPDPEDFSDRSEVVNSERLARKVGDDLRWLLTSDEIQAIALKGISSLEVTNGPRSVASGAWHMRGLVTSEILRYRMRRNEP